MATDTESEHNSNLLAPPELLEIVDQLRDLNIGHEISLPQLVVVGDQGAGKSSLLESLTGIPFPKSQNLCTRFATQITCRRTPKECVKISILPRPGASEDHAKAVGGFKPHLESNMEFREEFSRILDQASEKMGLRTDVRGDQGDVFSEDVLKIELHGPEENLLTIIDVPGIFRTTEYGLTRKDMVTVRNMVTRYIENSRTIILAVLPANTEFAASEILELAKDYDKDGTRTLGILTKPDLVTEPSKQQTVCDLMNGDKHPLSLGYFLVRNQGEDDGPQTIQELDNTLREGFWVGLPGDRVGIMSLSTYVSSLLLEHTRKTVPGLIRDIEGKRQEFVITQDALGPPRSNDSEQRQFLCHIAGKFQSIRHAALGPDYAALSDTDEDEVGAEMLLITRITNLTDDFRILCTNKGHTRTFEPLGSPGSTLSTKLVSNTKIPITKTPADDVQEILTESDRLEMLRDLSSILEEHLTITRPLHDIKEWIEKIYLSSRSLNLGGFDPNIISVAFTEQSRKWEDITILYMNKIIASVHQFMFSALRLVCPDTAVRNGLWSALLGDLMKCYKKGLARAKFLVRVERRQKPYTLNPQFAQNLAALKGSRLAETLRPTARVDNNGFGDTQYLINIQEVGRASEVKSRNEQIQEEIHDVLQAYYDQALYRFIDNVFQQAVNFQLINSDESPLKVFTTDWVLKLPQKRVAQIAGESREKRRRRGELTKQIEKMTRGLEYFNGR